MALFEKVLNLAAYPECEEPIRSEVLAAAGGPLIEGQAIMYLQVVGIPPRLQVCKCTIGPDDVRP